MSPDPHTPRRTVRIATSLWLAAQAKAEARSETLTDVIRRALERYVSRSPKRRKEVGGSDE